MEETYTIKALILKRTDFREADSKVILYSPQTGRLELVARGAKKQGSKIAAHIEPINICKVMVVKGKTFDYVGSAKIENSFLNIKQDLNNMYYAGLVVGIFLKLVVDREESDAVINFAIISQFLQHLDTVSGYNPKLAKNAFILKILDNLGYKPELYNCAVCGAKLSPKNNFFDLHRGGIICHNCQQNQNYCYGAPDECVKLLRFLHEKSFLEIGNLKVNGETIEMMDNLLSKFLQYNFGV